MRRLSKIQKANLLADVEAECAKYEISLLNYKKPEIEIEEEAVLPEDFPQIHINWKHKTRKVGISIMNIEITKDGHLDMWSPIELREWYI